MPHSSAHKQQWLLKACFALCLTCILGVITLSSGSRHDLDDVVEAGVLKIITRNSPTTYYQDKDQTSGFEYELASMFADFLGVKLEVQVADSLDDLISQVEAGNVAIAAAGLTVTPERSERITFSSSYLDVNQKLVYRISEKRPQSLADILGKTLVVTAHSSHAQYLHQLQQSSMPELSWIERDDAEVSELVQMVENGEIDFTIVDSNEFDSLVGFYPNVASALELGETQQLAWAFSKYTDNTLLNKSREFFQLIRETGLLSQLEERYYGHLKQIDNVGTLTFLAQADKRLHKYQGMFEREALNNDLDWRLLAAIGYQESHWKARARSRTGVRGLMMLTRTTAKEMGVKNRLNAEQSIKGGSAYFAKLKNRFEDIAEPDRTWIALAAYNVGYGHVKDAQLLTEQHGGNPERWMDIKETLPLLTQKKYYKKAKHGYARGYEPVEYVQNIRRFYDLLVWREQPEPTYQVVDANNGSFFTADSGYKAIPPFSVVR